MSENGRIMLTADDGSEEAFFVLEDDAEALILKEKTDGETVVYEVLEDEKELAIISKYMEELLEDIDLKIEE